MKSMLYGMLLLLALSGLPVPAQEAVPPAEPSAGVRLTSNVDSLAALLKSILSKEAEIAAVQEELVSAPEEVTRNALIEELRELKEEERKLKGEFEGFATAVNTGLFTDEPEKKFDWQEELGSLLKPIMAELKNATAESRAIGDLRGRIEVQEKLYEVAAQACENLEQLVAADPPPNLLNRLQEALTEWTQRRDDADHQRTALQLQLDNRLAERESLLNEATGYAQTFFRTRGMNLFWGIAAFCLVFFGVRISRVLFRKVARSKKDRSFTSRLGTLLMQLFSVLGGLLAALFVFNMAGDWFLLGIIIIFLLGVAWASVKTLPQYVETVKLILNIGPVKERERIVFAGIPWRVDALGFAARLVNPLLDGGVQTMPVRYLVGMHSRPNGDHEEWFPCREGDWVELGDGRFGRVAYQTPSTVQVVELGGSQVVYQTPDFVALSPRTLSTNFRITETFGIDYKHQAMATTEIPATMEAALKTGLGNVVDADLIKHVRVEFACAAASSLDFAIDLDVDGKAASKLPTLKRAISRILVDACNKHGWEIPFTQVTMHQAT